MSIGWQFWPNHKPLGKMPDFPDAVLMSESFLESLKEMLA